MIRVRKSQRSLKACQGGYRRPGTEGRQSQPSAQAHHVALCLVAYLIVERERRDHGVTWREWKRNLILTGTQTTLPALERVRKAA